MRGRALTLAALAFLVGLSGTIAAGSDVAQAQQLDAGKPPSQIFASTCSVCHRSPRGLVKNVSPGALPGFLRQHYTTGSDMAGVMAAYVLGSGGTDRVAEPPPATKREPKQRAKSDAVPDVATRNPDAKEQPKAAKQKAAKKGPADAAKQEAAKGPADAAKEEIAKPEPVKPEPEKVEAAKPATPAAEPPKSEAAVTDPAKEAAPETKPAAVAAPAQAPAAPRQPTSLLTLPGFPPPVAEPEPTPTATTPAASEPAKPSAPASPAAEASTPAPVAEAPKAEAAKIEPVKPAEAAPSEEPNTDIMREEVHAPAPARSGQKKRAPQPPQ